MENRKLFQKVEILCECCGKNLLEKDSMGIFVTWLANQKSSNGKDVYQKAYYCCKGKCDDILKKKSMPAAYRQTQNGCYPLLQQWQLVYWVYKKEPTVDEITPRRRTNIR